MKKLLSILISVIMLCSSSFINAYARADLYTDVPDGFWAYDAIKYSSDRKWFSGYEDGSFKPYNSITRAEAAKVISVFLTLRKNPVLKRDFDDVDPAAWYAAYVKATKNIFPNAAGSSFRPNDPMTREDTIYVLVTTQKLNRKIKFLDMSLIDEFSDSSFIDPELKPYLAIGIQSSLISGYSDGTIGPKKPLTRAEFATLLYRATQLSSEN